MSIRDMNQSAQKKKDFVLKVMRLMETEKLTAAEANSIPDLLGLKLKRSSDKEASNRLFTIQEEDDEK